MFHDAKVVTENPRKCCMLITKLLHLVTQGDELSSNEVTEVFFGVTKLFQSNDMNLRRCVASRPLLSLCARAISLSLNRVRRATPPLRSMVYFFIKEVAEHCDPDDIIIVTSSLTKDMNSSEDLYRANSIRVLAKMIDATMLGAIERYIKQAIVDKNALVASSALIAGMHLLKVSSEVVRRWVSEVQEAVHSPSEAVQFHALSLLYSIKSHDRLAVSKMVSQMTRVSMGSPLATCLLIRYISQILREPGAEAASNAQAAQHFLEMSLRHKSEMVIYEAAKAICELPPTLSRDLSPAITVLQLFLSSPKPTLRFAAMRTLSAVARDNASAVVKCNDDMESLIADSNRSIATLAITTLLKTGSEGSVDRLMKQISTFMNEIADEFKIVVVTAIRQLCLKYPQKHRVLVGFLANFLREEGGFEFKKAIVDSILELVDAIPETKESSLFHLCEFIEDCEFTALSTQILHLIGALGPTTAAPARYIRFVYNRVILENASVRAAAISALAKFAAQVPSLKPSVAVLLNRSLHDDDDEVRDRATIALAILDEDGDAPDAGAEAPAKHADLLLEGLSVSFSNLELAVAQFEAQGGVDDGQPLTFDALPVIEETLPPVLPTKPGIPGVPSIPGVGDAGGLAGAPAAAPVVAGASLPQIPEFAALGRIFRSTAASALTESETEYVVTCTKHIFEAHLVLEFSITNTIEDQMLKDCMVHVSGSDPELYATQSEVPIAELPYGNPGACFVILERDVSRPITPATFACELKFNVVEVDPKTGEPEGDPDGFAEEYPVEDLEVNTSDFMARKLPGDFKRAWEGVGNDAEVQEKFSLQFKKLDDAVAAVIEFLGMQPCDNTQLVPDSSASVHNLHLSGVFCGGVAVLVRSQLQMDPAGSVVLKIAVRSENAEVSQMVADCIR